MKSQITAFVQNVLHLNQCSCTLSKVLVLLQKVHRHKNGIGKVSHHFQLELNALEILSAPKNKKINN
jgi:hypothetical protein